MKQYIFLIGVLLVVASCVKKEFDLEALRAPQEYSIEEARNVDIIYSDSAQLRVRIQGPLLRRYVYRFRVDEEFPEGVAVTFFDQHGNASAWLHARYAIRVPYEHRTTVRDSVVLYNTVGERLEGPELIWDEENKTISTEKFVKITRQDEIIYSRGFKSNQEFTRYELYAVEGNMLFDELAPDRE